MAKSVKIRAFKRLSGTGKIENVDAHIRKIESSNSHFRVTTGVFGRNEVHRITSKNSDIIGMFPKHLFSEKQALVNYKKQLGIK